MKGRTWEKAEPWLALATWLMIGMLAFSVLVLYRLLPAQQRVINQQRQTIQLLDTLRKAGR